MLDILYRTQAAQAYDRTLARLHQREDVVEIIEYKTAGCEAEVKVQGGGEGEGVNLLYCAIKSKLWYW